MACKGVLVVEDDRDILENMRTACELEGYDVFAAENGQVALDYLRGLSTEKIPCCILLDLMMPVMDGMGFVKALAQNFPDTLARIPIAVVTAKGNVGEEKKLMPMEVEFLHKPVDLDELFQVIERHCGKPGDFKSCPAKK